MAIRLPEARFSQAPQGRKRDIPIEAILQTLGRNPYADALDSVGPVLSDALAKRAELRRPTVIAQVNPDGTNSFLEVPVGKKFGGVVRVPGTASTPKPPPPPKPRQKIGVTAEGYPISFDPNTGTNMVARPGKNGGIEQEPYFGHPLPSTQGSEEQRRAGLLSAGTASISDARKIIATSPGALSQMKAIQYSPGNVYRHIASSEGKELYNNVSNAIQMQKYIETGATMNPDELERATHTFMASMADSPQEFISRLDLLERNSRGFMLRQTPQQKGLQKIPDTGSRKATHRWNPATGKVEPF